MYKSIDLFAGIGGIRMGFERAFGEDIETVFISEWDVKAQETYRANYGTNPPIAGDITAISEQDIPAHDILLAGFPCQAFSQAGRKLGFEDTRGTLFFDVARIVRHHKPRVVFCENVKNLFTHDKGRTFAVIRTTLEEVGYTVFAKVLNSRNFGVPQNRERIYIVAFRNDIAPEYFEFPDKTDDTKRLKDILHNAPVPAKYFLSDVYYQGLKAHRARHEAKGHGFGFEIRGGDDIAAAVVCGGMGRERNLVCDPLPPAGEPSKFAKGPLNKLGIRKLTPREWARLQGFPDSYLLPVADTHLYKQFGNSVTVPVIEALARCVRDVLENPQSREFALRCNEDEEANKDVDRQ